MSITSSAGSRAASLGGKSSGRSGRNLSPALVVIATAQLMVVPPRAAAAAHPCRPQPVGRLPDHAAARHRDVRHLLLPDDLRADRPRLQRAQGRRGLPAVRRDDGGGVGGRQPAAHPHRHPASRSAARSGWRRSAPWRGRRWPAAPAASLRRPPDPAAPWPAPRCGSRSTTTPSRRVSPAGSWRLRGSRWPRRSTRWSPSGSGARTSPTPRRPLKGSR
jgi:hypothetical protein